MKIFLGLLCLGFLVGFISGTQDHRLPRFADYPVKKVFDGKPARVRIQGNPQARRFRTVIRWSVSKGVNFAGHYAYVEWGCGTSCQQHAIVDVKTGKVFMYPGLRETSFGALCRKNSCLLITDPIDSSLMEGHGEDIPDWAITRYWIWNGKRLTEIDSSTSTIGADSTL